VLSVKYSCEGTGPSTQLVTSTKVSGSLAGLPAGLNWRVSFAANAPNSVLSPTGDYSFGLSDRGDQFYLRASTDPTQSQFAFGTAVRNSDGSISYTQRGTAAGSFDTATNTITMKVQNAGPDAATGVTATDQLPKNAGYGSTSTTQGTCSLKPEKAIVSCNLGTLASGTTVTITINVKPTKKGQITNTVSVAST